MFDLIFKIILTFFLIMFVSCSSTKILEETPLAHSVDLEKFMGKWYVVANIPNFLEKDAFNSIEFYELSENFLEDRAVKTTFTFNKGSFEGKLKTYKPTGFVQRDPSNAIWKMQFFWPFKADYRIVFLDDNYSEAIIGRNQRDYVWIMARQPELSDVRYEFLINKAFEAGYNKALIKKVPQKH